MLVKPMTEEDIYEIGTMPSATMTTKRKWECPLPFPGKKPRQTISVLMCAGCCGAAFCTLPASGARAISPISCQRRRWYQDDVAHCLRNAAQLHPETSSAIWYRYQAGRGFPARPHGQGKETLHFRWTSLCAGEISGAGIYAKGAGHCLCRGRPAGRVGDSGNGCQRQVRQYVHLGMELAGTHDLSAFGKLYDLIKYPKPSNENGTV